MRVMHDFLIDIVMLGHCCRGRMVFVINANKLEGALKILCCNKVCFSKVRGFPRYTSFLY